VSADITEDNCLKPDRTTRTHGLPRILLASDLLSLIARDIHESVRTRGKGVETGGMLTGEFENANGNSVFKLRGFIGAGPRAEYSPESVLFDADYQSEMLRRMWRRYPRSGNMGCIHVHPEDWDRCSDADRVADIEAVRLSDTKSLVFGIITIDNERQDPLSVRYENLKFDFFVLGRQTRYEYVHVPPAIMSMPLIDAESSANPSGLTNAATRHNRHYAVWPGLLRDKKRLVAEVRAMEERYGGRATLRFEGNRLFWEYTVVESGRRFPIRVVYPRRYPFEPPRIMSLIPLPASPHQMPSDEICWTNRAACAEWNPARDTAVVCIHAAHRWFACLLVYLTLGKWPAEADHGIRYST
jgi:hypothetical protein